MPRKNCNARPVNRPNESWISLLPYDGRIKMRVRGARLRTTGESIVREFRIAGRGARVEIPVSEKPISTFERVVRIFLIFVTGWLLGYMHHFLSGR